MGESEMGIGICPKKRLWFKKQKRRIENIQIWSFKNQKEYIYIYQIWKDLPAKQTVISEDGDVKQSVWYEIHWGYKPLENWLTPVGALLVSVEHH
jgi:hypothetical protein